MQPNLDTGVLATTVDSLETGRVRHGENIAHVMMRMDGIKTSKCPRRPDLHLLATQYVQ